MGVTYEQMRAVSAELYAAALKKVPDNTLDALRRAIGTESHELARRTLEIMLRSAEKAEREDRLVCSDAGVPVYVVEIGTAVRIGGRHEARDHATASTTASKRSTARSSSTSPTR